MAAGDKSFEELTIPELRAVAESFGVDLDGKTRKADIISEIKEMGVTWGMYEATLAEVEEEDVDLAVLDETPLSDDIEVVVPVIPEDEVEVLIKMIRPNYTYQVRGYTFKREHPFALVSEEDADYLVEVDGGFRMASPREAREFYGQ